MTRYVVYDVFTDCAFGGNPLAIVPDASALPEDALQRIAREFNLSETVFLFGGTSATDARVRIFTPMQEVPFAGHPLIGTAVMLADEGAGPDLRLELPDGPLRAQARAGTASFLQSAGLEILHRPDRSLVARCLGLPPHSVLDATLGSVGLPFCLVRLASTQCLDAVMTDTDAFRRAQQVYPTTFDFAVYCYVPDGADYQARMFAPLDGIPEDPATGSAAAALGAMLRDSSATDQRFEIVQGCVMGRPSRIGVEATHDGVRISGNAVRVMEGRLLI